MRKVSSLWLLAGVSTLAGCSSAPASGPLSASEPSTTSTTAAISTANDAKTRTPIKHVIVIIGENRTFDHVFATYKPKPGQSVDNLLSKGIIQADGTPGPNFALATQYSAIDSAPAQDQLPLNSAQPTTYQISPGDKTAYTKLPPPGIGGPKTAYIPTVAEGQAIENGLENPDYVLLTTGGTGVTGSHMPDPRIFNVSDLPPGPFQLTPGVAYDAYAASPVHRFYQMWQQLDCNVEYITQWNPSGCRNDLFSWVETTVGAGSNGKPQPANFSNFSTGEGSTALGFYNVQQGDAPYLTWIADNFAMSDNYHQAVQGGTGANHVALGTGDAIYYSDGNGNATVPPAQQIENPDPQAGTNNYYTEDGYGANDGSGGGTFSACSDSDQPGVGSVVSYLEALPRPVNPRCEPGHYYLLNNYNPGYYGDGSVATAPVMLGGDAGVVAPYPFTIPPSTLPTIGERLLEKQVSFAYFGGDFNKYLSDPGGTDPTDVYCNICNFFQYSTAIMTNTAVRTAALKDTADFYAGIASGTLPAVSFVKPSGLLDGHPASSKLDLFEGFVKKIVDGVQGNDSLWSDTAIIVTFDEGGGYYDSGYVQPLDFFGDGTRIPALVVSKFTQTGKISHEYADHVSVLKFIERNWDVPPVSNRSRDNFPNPVQTGPNRYAPVNGPAIGDLFDLFDFSKK